LQDAREGLATTPSALPATPRSGHAATPRAPASEPVRSGPWVAAGLFVFAAVWLSYLAHDSLAPPMDNIEQMTWVRSLEWGYYKHPPLPTWLVWLPVRLFGLSAWTGYLLGAACTLAALGSMWHLLTRLRGEAYAAVALLAALCITYYNGRLYYYNHNVVLLLLSAASATLCWQAFATRRLRWWIGLGFALGLGALAKYQVAVTIASVLAFAAQQRAWRDPTHRLGALLAGLIGLLLFAPHVEWLRTHDFGPIRYAIESSLGARLEHIDRVTESAHWLLDQVFNRALPALLLLAVAARSRDASRPPSSAVSNRNDPARALLLSWGLVPLLFMPLVGVLVGADLQLHWGTSFLLFAVPAAMEFLPRERWRRVDWQRTLGAFVVIQGLLLALGHATSPHGPVSLREHHWRAFDAAGLAERVAGPARSELGGPVRVVISPAAKAGALALLLPERPLVLIDGRYDRSPWVAPDLVRRCGALELGSTSVLAVGQAVGSEFPGLAWHVRRRDPAAAPCPRSIDPPATRG
jgi:4-amino-4-deoxy-L-arabinose transferase-like glycosyltransferase